MVGARVPSLVLRKPGKQWGRGLPGMEKVDVTGRVPGLCLGCLGLGAQQSSGPASSRILTLILSPAPCPQTSAL